MTIIHNIIILPVERHLFSHWLNVDNLSIHLTSFRLGSHKGMDLSLKMTFQEDETKKILPSVILRIQYKLIIMKNKYLGICYYLIRCYFVCCMPGQNIER